MIDILNRQSPSIDFVLFVSYATLQRSLKCSRRRHRMPIPQGSESPRGIIPRITMPLLVRIAVQIRLLSPLHHPVRTRTALPLKLKTNGSFDSGLPCRSIALACDHNRRRMEEAACCPVFHRPPHPKVGMAKSQTIRSQQSSDHPQKHARQKKEAPTAKYWTHPFIS